MNRIKIIGSTLRNRSLLEKASLMKTLEKEVWPKLVSGDILPVVEAICPFSEAGEAHELMASNNTTGKIILSKTT